ncbi:MAG: Hsp33 family molecular chaperone HslO [Pseudomonadota bacterium]
MSENDQLRRFLFEDAPLRGHWVRLEDAWREAREHQQLPPAVRELLGEALAATVLLAGSLKFDGTLTLQLQGGSGLVPMLVAQATSELTLRGVAHVDAQALAAGTADEAQFKALVGDGQLVISVEQGEGASPWQGIVPLVGDSLSACLEQYFEASEQVATCVVLAASDFSAAGVLLQKLPAPGGPGEAEEAQLRDVWDEAAALLKGADPEELLAREPDDLLARVFPSFDVRLFDGSPVSFACRCGRERVATMLQSLGREEIDSILEEQGTVTVTCEFCQRPYTFDAVDAGQLFLEVPAAQPPPSMN